MGYHGLCDIQREGRDMSQRLKEFGVTPASVCFALFIAVNATGIWGGVFPFLPISFQTPQILFSFFLAQALCFAGVFLATAVTSYYLPRLTRKALLPLAAVPYFAGWAFLIAAIYLHKLSMPLAIAGGACLGMGSAGFYMLWQRVFAGQSPVEGNRELVCGTCMAAILYFALYVIPVALTTYLIPLVFLPLFCLGIVLAARKVDLSHPMFEDIPMAHPLVYRRALHDLWPSALCMGAGAFSAGTMRALAIVDPSIGSWVNVMSMVALFAGSLAILLLWSRKNLRFNIINIYRVLFPFIITLLVWLPFLGESYCQALAAILYAIHALLILLMMMQCAQISRDRGINPLFSYGCFGGIVFGLHDVGFIAGCLSERLADSGISVFGAAAVVAIWLLALMYYLSHREFAANLGTTLGAESFELLRRPAWKDDASLARPSVAAVVAASGTAGDDGDDDDVADEELAAAPSACDTVSGEEAPASPSMNYRVDVADSSTHGDSKAQLSEPYEPKLHVDGGNRSYTDRVSKQVQMLKEDYALSAREAEVAEMVARGDTVARIAEQLFVSENTVRTHTKRIYVKLDIHKKQELIDLVRAYQLG